VADTRQRSRPRRGEGRRKGRDGGWRRSPFTLFLSASLGLASLRVPQTFQISAYGANCDVLGCWLGRSSCGFDDDSRVWQREFWWGNDSPNLFLFGENLLTPILIF
jgi:hypothetical protein